MTPYTPTKERTQLAHFLRIPIDWNAYHEGETIVLTGPAGAQATLPNRKSDFTPDQWRAAAAAAILALVPAERKNGAIPIAEYLSLPAGWKATAFPSTIEMEGPNGERCGIPIPYQPTARQVLIEQAHAAVGETLRKTCNPT